MARLVLIHEALEHTDYTADHIRNLLSRGAIEGKKVGWVWLVDLESLQEYERRMKEAGDAKYRPKSLGPKDPS
ncbi:MAG TPA: hypothetical protein PKE45_01865 [Caldilineaceae bacterium]|nr:hypothetical protein [Caldilineaceae bacterium]